jgi:hypothetical protein
MARGWESKAVEGQIEIAEAEKPENPKGQRSPAELDINRQRDVLLLSRSRVLRQIEGSRNERYTEQLNRALGDLDAQLAKLGPKPAKKS